MFKIISKFGIGELKKCFDPKLVGQLVDENGDFQGDKLMSIVGMNIAFDVASWCSKMFQNAKMKNDFLTLISNLKRKELEKMSMVTFFEMIVDVVQKKEFKDFFGVVSKSFKQGHRVSMDLLFKRYANPFLLLDNLIATGRFLEFIFELIDIQNEEKYTTFGCTKSLTKDLTPSKKQSWKTIKLSMSTIKMLKQPSTNRLIF